MKAPELHCVAEALAFNTIDSYWTERNLQRVVCFKARKTPRKLKPVGGCVQLKGDPLRRGRRSGRRSRCLRRRRYRCWTSASTATTDNQCQAQDASGAILPSGNASLTQSHRAYHPIASAKRRMLIAGMKPQRCHFGRARTIPVLRLASLFATLHFLYAPLAYGLPSEIANETWSAGIYYPRRRVATRTRPLLAHLRAV
jgi:hypothetical protein